MNEITVSTASGHTTTQKIYKIERIEEVINDDDDMDDDDEPPSSPGSMYDEDMEMGNLNDDVVQQLAAAGPVGVAAAAAIASSKKRRRHHSFETNPSIRKRQQNRLLRKLRQIIYEFTGRVGQQAIVLVATPGKPNTSFKVFGAKPLEDVVRNLKSVVMEELETALANQAPPPQQEDPTLFELPPLIIDGIPTPVEKMTQAQLRAFIPLMLKYSTGRGKPGWGRESTRPPWWPKELPWANVRMDARTEEDKQKISWTHALRKIVVNCYKYHGREDLLPTFSDDEEKNSIMITNSVGSPGSHNGQAQIHIQTTSQSTSSSQTSVVTTTAAAVEAARQQANNSNYTQAVISTIQNADGTVSLFQMDPNNPIITLPDGTTAQVQGVATLHQGEGGATIQTVQSLTDANGHENMTVDLTEATLGQDGQIIITGEDGQGYPVSVGNMITLPVSSSIYQTMMANIQHIQPNGDGTVCIAPMQQQQSQHHNKQTTHMLPNAKLVRAIFQDNLPNRSNLNHNNNNNNHSNNNNSNNSSDLASQSLLNHSNNNNNNSSSNNHNTSNNNSSQSQHEMFGNPTTTTTYIQIQHPQHQTSSSSPNSNSSSSCSSTICCSSSAVTPTTYTTVPPLTTVINRTNNICQKQVLLTTKRRKQGFNELILHQHDSSSSSSDQKLKKRSKMMEVEQDDDVDDEAEEGGVEESDVGVDVGELEEVGEVTIKVELQSQLSLSPTEVKLEDEDQIGSN